MIPEVQNVFFNINVSVPSIGSSGRVGGPRNKIYVAAFGGHPFYDLLLARLESAYLLIWGAHGIWEQDLGTFMISRPI